MATACFWLVTFLPELPDLSSPRFHSRMTLPILAVAALPYLRPPAVFLLAMKGLESKRHAKPCLSMVSSFSKLRRTSATLHACATQPRAMYGASPSKISLIWPTQASLR
jgi:hypothetical protein